MKSRRFTWLWRFVPYGRDYVRVRDEQRADAARAALSTGDRQEQPFGGTGAEVARPLRDGHETEGGASSLSFRERQIIGLHDDGGWDFERIAQKLDVSPGRARHYYTQAKRSLAQREES